MRTKKHNNHKQFNNNMVNKLTTLPKAPVAGATTYAALIPFLPCPGEWLHLADISRALGQPHPTVRLWLARLEMQGLLQKTHKGRMSLFHVNLQSPLVLDALAIAEKLALIRKLRESPLLAAVVDAIHAHVQEDSLIFGSAAEDIKKAGDIDMLILGSAKQSALQDALAWTKKRAHIIAVSGTGKISPGLRAELIRTHLLIQGTERFVRWMHWPAPDGANNSVGK